MGQPVWNEDGPAGQQLLSQHQKDNIYKHLPALTSILDMGDLWAKLKQYGVIDIAKIHRLEVILDVLTVKTITCATTENGNPH